MKIDERRVDDVVVLDLHGKLLLGEGDELLRDKIEQVIEAGDRKVLLNLKNVPYVDSAGLGELVRCYTTLSRKDGRLKLVNMSQRVQDLLAVTKLNVYFHGGEDEQWPNPDA